VRVPSVAEVVIEVADGTGSFASLLGGLLRANLEADPRKERLVHRTSGTVGIRVSDTEEEVRLHFAGGQLWVTDGPAGMADLRLVGTADVLMGLSTVPLRFGMPDPLSSAGRAMTGRWAVGGLQLHGLPRAAPLLRTVLQLLSVLA
jgi:hypothetical protein